MLLFLSPPLLPHWTAAPGGRKLSFRGHASVPSNPSAPSLSSPSLSSLSLALSLSLSHLPLSHLSLSLSLSLSPPHSPCWCAAGTQRRCGGWGRTSRKAQGSRGAPRSASSDGQTAPPHPTPHPTPPPLMRPSALPEARQTNARLHLPVDLLLLIVLIVGKRPCFPFFLTPFPPPDAVCSRRRLTGCSVEATDLRCGAALVLTGLGAEGVTAIHVRENALHSAFHQWTTACP